jgi:hypothetical protein
MPAVQLELMVPEVAPADLPSSGATGHSAAGDHQASSDAPRVFSPQQAALHEESLHPQSEHSAPHLVVLPHSSMMGRCWHLPERLRNAHT